MKLKLKTLCGVKKSTLKDHFDEIQQIVATPRFVCSKCCRVASYGNYLCKAKKLKNS